MYEDQTYDVILKRMLDRVPADIDKREGSIIFDALAPAAAELAQNYINLDISLRLLFAQTSSGEYLEMRTAEMGIDRHVAIKAQRKGLFYGNDNEPLDVLVGNRFSIEGLNYIVLNKIAVGEFTLECETAGSSGNRSFGSMIPIEYVSGLTRAELSDVLVQGEDEETDASLLNRYLLRARKPATSGNVSQYRQWALDVTGVGDAKIISLWSGPGTVKVVIVDSTMQPATTALVAAVAAYIESVRPIGASVSVVSAVEKVINISVSGVVLVQGYTLQMVSPVFASAVQTYLKETVFGVSYISQAKISALLLSTTGIADFDYADLLLNGDIGNISLNEDEVAKLGTVDMEV